MQFRNFKTSRAPLDPKAILNTTMASQCFVIDNGAGRIKYGPAGHAASSSSSAGLSGPDGSIPNCVARMNKQMQVLIGDQVDEVANGSLLSYTRPFERGYMTNVHCQTEVWSRLFTKILKVANPGETSLVLTEAPFTPENIQNDMNEVIFEDFGFKEYLRRPAAWFSAYEYSQANPLGDRCTSSPNSCTIVDSGFSFTHIMPFVEGKCCKSAVKRVNVGGKLLTNFLKEIVSYRQWNMMDEFKLMDQVKEQLCYVSKDFQQDLSSAYKAGLKRTAGQKRNAPATDYLGGKMKKGFVLPDFQNIMSGYVKDDDAADQSSEQLLSMETERFSVPEVLFHPSDVQMNQAGIAGKFEFEMSYRGGLLLYTIVIGVLCYAEWCLGQL